MKSDTRALLKVIGASVLVALLVMGVLIASAFGAIPKDKAAAVALVGIVIGGILIGRTFSQRLMTRDGKPDPPA